MTTYVREGLVALYGNGKWDIPVYRNFYLLNLWIELSRYRLLILWIRTIIYVDVLALMTIFQPNLPISPWKAQSTLRLATTLIWYGNGRAPRGLDCSSGKLFTMLFSQILKGREDIFLMRIYVQFVVDQRKLCFTLSVTAIALILSGTVCRFLIMDISSATTIGMLG